MIFFKKLIPFIAALICAILLELLLVSPDSWFLLLVIISFTIGLTTYYLNHAKLNKNFFGFSLSPLIFALSGYLFLFFLETAYLEQIIIGVIFLGLAIFWSNLVNYIWDKPRYQTFALENISSYLNLLSAFFIFVSAFNLFVLGVGRIRYLIILILFAALALSWQTFWINKIENKSKKYFPFIFALVFIELFWVMHYLPISYLVTGIILTAVFYTGINITRFHLLNNLTTKVITRYVVIALVVIASALITASWT